jgi:hypothetical protein
MTVESLLIDLKKQTSNPNMRGKEVYVGDRKISLRNKKYGVLAKYDATCQLCGLKPTEFEFMKKPSGKNILFFYGIKNGRKTEMTIDHIVPSSQGGSNVHYNLTVLCSHCNMTKSDKPADEVGLDMTGQYVSDPEREAELLEICKKYGKQLFRVTSLHGKPFVGYNLEYARRKFPGHEVEPW